MTMMKNTKHFLSLSFLCLTAFLLGGCNKYTISVESNKVPTTLETNALTHISGLAAKMVFKEIKRDLTHEVKVDLSKATLPGFITDQELIHYKVDTTAQPGKTCLLITPLYAEISNYLAAVISKKYKGDDEHAEMIVEAIAGYIVQKLQQRLGTQQSICINKTIPPNVWNPLEPRLRIIAFKIREDFSLVEIKTNPDRMEALASDLIAKLIRGDIRITIRPKK